MPETNINAAYADLEEAKKKVISAQGEVSRIEKQIVNRGYELPAEPETDKVSVEAPEVSKPELDKSETTTSDTYTDLATAGADVTVTIGASGPEEKPLSKQNKAELLETAKSKGIEVQGNATKQEIIKVIESQEGQE